MSYAYACGYVDPVLTSQSYDISISTRRTNTSVLLVLMLMLMSPVFSLAYTCTCAYAYVSKKQAKVSLVNARDSIVAMPTRMFLSKPKVLF